MAKHEVRMTEPEHDILNADIDFWVKSDEEGQLGHLHVSRGGIDWYDGKASVLKRSVTWEQFRTLIVKSVSETRAVKKKVKR